MKELGFFELSLAPLVEQLAPSENLAAGVQCDHHSANLLHCTPNGQDRPDRRYWTIYDHFMAALEARADRRARLFRRIRRAWRMAKLWLRPRAAATSRAPRTACGASHP